MSELFSLSPVADLMARSRPPFVPLCPSFSQALFQAFRLLVRMRDGWKMWLVERGFLSKVVYPIITVRFFNLFVGEKFDGMRQSFLIVEEY